MHVANGGVRTYWRSKEPDLQCSNRRGLCGCVRGRRARNPDATTTTTSDSLSKFEDRGWPRNRELHSAPKSLRPLQAHDLQSREEVTYANLEIERVCEWFWDRPPRIQVNRQLRAGGPLSTRGRNVILAYFALRSQPSYHTLLLDSSPTCFTSDCM